MRGLARICKLHGKMTVKGMNGICVEWVWDYFNDKPVLKSEMTKEELAVNEKRRIEFLKTKTTQQ